MFRLIFNADNRRDQSILRATLPKKVEFVISCKLTPMQYELYQVSSLNSLS